MSPEARPRPETCFDIFPPICPALLRSELNSASCAVSATSPKIALSTLFSACLFSGAITNTTTVRLRLRSHCFEFTEPWLKTTHTHTDREKAFSRSSVVWLSLTCSEALVTSLFQPREMEFDSGCSCPESSGECIKKASQQCWQEYIYRDCVSFQGAAGGGGAGRHRSSWQPGHLISTSSVLDRPIPGSCFALYTFPFPFCIGHNSLLFLHFFFHLSLRNVKLNVISSFVFPASESVWFGFKRWKPVYGASSHISASN